MPSALPAMPSARGQAGCAGSQVEKRRLRRSRAGSAYATEGIRGESAGLLCLGLGRAPRGPGACWWLRRALLKATRNGIVRIQKHVVV
eukprot:1531232-Alexandrium_andersonii.AAC.1